MVEIVKKKYSPNGKKKGRDSSTERKWEIKWETIGVIPQAAAKTFLTGFKLCEGTLGRITQSREEMFYLYEKWKKKTTEKKEMLLVAWFLLHKDLEKLPSKAWNKDRVKQRGGDG